MVFKQDNAGLGYIAAGIRGEWQIVPFNDAKHGERHTLVLHRVGEKPRPFGQFLTPDDAETAAERYDARGN